ncbi:hypothetical protein ACFL0Q_02900 [Thermodesulfobacteriota bacterium]
MSNSSAFEAVRVGQELGVFELTLDEATVRERVGLVQWEALGPEEGGNAPPGITIVTHAHMKFAAFPEMKASIWAKSEHEFFKPMKLGSTVRIRGRVVDTYVKRGRNYVVTELETLDETGDVLMRSRETGVWVE